MRRLVLYMRDGCHLCDEARELLRPLVREAGDIRFDEVDIDTDDRLLTSFLERIPVVELDGRIVGELEPDVGALRTALLHTSPR